MILSSLLQTWQKLLRSIVVTPTGNILPLSYGFSEDFIMGNIADIKTGKDIFRDFISHKGKALYDIFGATYHALQEDTETDMIGWTERILKQSRKAKLPHLAALID